MVDCSLFALTVFGWLCWTEVVSPSVSAVLIYRLLVDDARVTQYYVDNFCCLVQGNRRERRAVKHILFQALDQVFRPLDAKDTNFRKEPASIKKFKKR